MATIRSVELEAHTILHTTELEISVSTGVKPDGKPGNRASAPRVRIRREGTTGISVDPFSFMANANGRVAYYDVDIELEADSDGEVSHSIALKKAFLESWELACTKEQVVYEEIIVRPGTTEYNTEGKGENYTVKGFSKGL